MTNLSLTKINSNIQSNTLIDSFIQIDRIFTGNYWDEFAIPLFLRNKIETALLLGVGYGSGLRSLWATAPNLHITGIDNDAKANSACASIFNKYFNRHPKLITADAQTYLQQTNEKFDLIWIDLYDSQGPVAETFNFDFWRQIKNHLSPNGVVAINVYGIANHLEPYVDESPLKAIYGLINVHFSKCILAPHRRNTTIIASNVCFEIASPNYSNINLDPFDQLTLRTHKRRAHSLLKKQNPILSGDSLLTNGFSFQQLNELQQKAWGTFLYDLNQVTRDEHLYFSSPRSLVEHLRNEKTGPPFIDLLRRTQSPLIVMIPTFLGADIHNHQEPFDWYFRYLTDHAQCMAQEIPYIWHTYFLPQWASMLNSRSELRTEANFEHLKDFL